MQKEQVKIAQDAQSLSAIQKNKAQSRNEITQASRQIGLKRERLEKLVADINIKGLSALESAISGNSDYTEEEIKAIQNNYSEIMNLADKVEANTKANEILKDNLIKSAFSDNQEYSDV